MTLTIAGRIAIIERLVTKDVGQRVDAKGSLLDEANTEHAGVDQAAPPVAPAESADDSGQDVGHDQDRRAVVAVLPDAKRVLVEIGDVRAADALGVLLHKHPTNVRVPEALLHGVGVLVGVGVAVVGPVLAGPFPDGALDGGSADGAQVDLEREGGFVARVGP